jgi:hypothetical protein
VGQHHQPASNLQVGPVMANQIKTQNRYQLGQLRQSDWTDPAGQYACRALQAIQLATSCGTCDAGVQHVTCGTENPHCWPTWSVRFCTAWNAMHREQRTALWCRAPAKSCIGVGRPRNTRSLKNALLPASTRPATARRAHTMQLRLRSLMRQPLWAHSQHMLQPPQTASC